MQPTKVTVRKEYRCQTCGGALKKQLHLHTCIFCGAEYKINENDKYAHYIQLRPACAPVLRAMQCVPYAAMCMNDPDEVSKFAKERVVHELARSLAPYIEFEESFDHITGTNRFTGTLRVVEPDFRF